MLQHTAAIMTFVSCFIKHYFSSTDFPDTKFYFVLPVHSYTLSELSDKENRIEFEFLFSSAIDQKGQKLL